MSLQIAYFCSFYGWALFHCINVASLSTPLSVGIKLFHCPWLLCKWCCSEHRGACIWIVVSLCICPGMGLLNHMQCVCWALVLIFKEPHTGFKCTATNWFLIQRSSSLPPCAPESTSNVLPEYHFHCISDSAELLCLYWKVLLIILQLWGDLDVSVAGYIFSKTW